MPCPNTIVSRVADFWRQLRRSFRQRRSAGGYAAGADGFSPTRSPTFILTPIPTLLCLDNLKSVDACHGKLTEVKEAGGLDNLETIQTSQSLTGFESRRSGLICLLKRKASNE
ncbi:hypothetical protein ACFX13_005316 [Malus domestica]|uniref:Uncharacterized protein n=1 Tax=Malus domestica TaxID=3750 RepID=A0A498IUT3_MALDO|nr:hypothetical protein DVH24_016970 [Malus domestica]